MSTESGQHRTVPPPSGGEPVVIAHIVTTLLYAAAGAGWLVLPDRTIAAVGTGAALVVGVAVTVLARARVSPTGKIAWSDVQDAIRQVVAEQLAAVATSTPAPPVLEPGPPPAPPAAPDPHPLTPQALSQAMRLPVLGYDDPEPTTASLPAVRRRSWQ